MRGKIIAFIMSLAVLLSAMPVYATENVITNSDDVDSLQEITMEEDIATYLSESSASDTPKPSRITIRYYNIDANLNYVTNSEAFWLDPGEFLTAVDTSSLPYDLSKTRFDATSSLPNLDVYNTNHPDGWYEFDGFALDPEGKYKVTQITEDNIEWDEFYRNWKTSICLYPVFKPASSGMEVVDYGDCGSVGSNVKWELVQIGVDKYSINISGSGILTDYISSAATPWSQYSSKIVSINIGEGVTAIGLNAFNGCSYVTNITFSSSVSVIGQNAFRRTSITELNLPDNIEVIGQGAFSGCDSLLSVIMSDSVTYLGPAAFEDCVNLSKVVLSDNITEIPNGAFLRTSITGELILPSKLKTIGEKAFSYGREVGERYEGYNLVIPNSVTSVGWAAFEAAPVTSLTLSTSMTEISENCFIGSRIENLVIPGNIKKVNRNAFAATAKLKNVVIYEGVEELSYGVFADSAVESIKLPASLTSISNNPEDIVNFDETPAFAECYFLNSIQVAGGNSRYTDKGDNLLFDKHDNKLIKLGLNSTIPSDTLILGENAISSKIADIVIPSNVKIIEQSAIDGCSFLTELTIAEGVEQIHPWAITNCVSLRNVSIPSTVKPYYNSRNGNYLTEIDLNTWYGGAACYLEKVENKSNEVKVILPERCSVERNEMLSWYSDANKTNKIGNEIGLGTAYSSKYNSGEQVTLTVRFNDGYYYLVDEAKQVVFGQPYGKLPTLDPARIPNGYSFEGWALGDEIITSDTIVKLRTDHILYPKYVKKKIRLLFINDNEYNTQYYPYGEKMGILPVPQSKPGSRFVGWYYYANGYTKKYLDENTINNFVDGNIFYAEWELDTNPKIRVAYEQLSLMDNIVITLGIDSKKTVKYAKVNGKKTTYNSTEYAAYGWVNLSVNPKNIDDVFTIELYDEEDRIMPFENGTDSYQITLAKAIQYMKDYYASEADFVELAKNLEQYCYATKKYFNYGDCSETVNITGVEADDIQSVEQTSGILPSGVKYAGSSLILGDSTTLRHYFSGDLSDCKAYISQQICGQYDEGVEVEIHHIGNISYVSISNIPPALLSRVYRLEIGDGTQTYTLDYNVMAYCKKVISRDATSNELKNVAKSMYLYGQSAEKYFSDRLNY